MPTQPAPPPARARLRGGPPALGRLLAFADADGVRDGHAALAVAAALFPENARIEHAELLAAALAARGDFEQAQQWQQASIEAARAAGRPDLVEVLERGFARLREGRRPWGD